MAQSWDARVERFGYITPDRGEGDIAIIADGFRELAEGQRVSFVVEPEPRGKGKWCVIAVSVI